MPHPPRSVDIRIENHGSLYLLCPMSPAADRWLQEYVDQTGPRWGDAYVVEPRYVADIVNGAREAGLEVR